MIDEQDSSERPQQPTRLVLVAQDGRALRPDDQQEYRGGGPPAGGSGGASDEAPVFASEEAMANILVTADLDGNWRYVSDDRWYHFLDGQCWRNDNVLGILNLARMVCRKTAQNVQLTTNTRRNISSAKSIYAVERIARSDPRVATPIEHFDADPWVINSPGGLVNLRSGELMPHDRAQLCMKMAGAAPYGDCPQWKLFIKQVSAGSQDYADYLQRLVGYSLTGMRSEEIFAFVYGPSNTGKSKFVETLRLLHGDYGTAAAMDTFIVSKVDRHPTDLAGLVGRRLVTAAETEEGRRWDQQRLTMLTGRDRVSARFMRGDFFEYVPQFLLLFAGNFRPRLTGVDDAMRRRMHLLPFTHKPPRIDPHLIDKFRAELGGITAWAVEGCLLWQRYGLQPPAIVTRATAAYFELEDSLGQWLDERCVISDPLNIADFFTPSRELYRDFRNWYEHRGFVPSERTFLDRLEIAAPSAQRGRRSDGLRGFFGIVLRGRQANLDL